MSEREILVQRNRNPNKKLYPKIIIGFDKDEKKRDPLVPKHEML
jgi:hypothetical protein